MIFFFSYTSINKLMKLNSFKINIQKTSVFDEKWISFLAISVISVELLTVLILLLNKKIGALLFTIIIISFTLYILYSKRLHSHKLHMN